MAPAISAGMPEAWTGMLRWVRSMASMSAAPLDEEDRTMAHGLPLHVAHGDEALHGDLQGFAGREAEVDDDAWDGQAPAEGEALADPLDGGADELAIDADVVNDPVPVAGREYAEPDEFDLRGGRNGRQGAGEDASGVVPFRVVGRGCGHGVLLAGRGGAPERVRGSSAD